MFMELPSSVHPCQRLFSRCVGLFAASCAHDANYEKFCLFNDVG